MKPSTTDGANPVRRKRSLWRLVAIGVPVVLLVLVLVVIVAGPSIASTVAPGIIASAARDSIQGELAVSDVRLSWRGPQSVGRVVLNDPDGRTVADISASADVGLLSLARGSMNLGTVRLSGAVDVVDDGTGATNMERAIEQRAAPGRPPHQPSAPGAPRPPEPFRLPPNLALSLDVQNLDIRFTRPVDGAPQTVGLKNVTATGSFANAQPVAIELAADTLEGEPAVRARFNADRLTDADGTPALSGATIDASVHVTIPARYVELVTGSLLKQGAAPSDAALAGEPLRIVADIVSRNGRLALADPSRPAFVQWRLPEAAAGALSGGESYIHLERRPLMSVMLSQLNLPLPDGAGGIDLRGANVRAVLQSEAVSGVLGFKRGDAPKAFRIDPVRLEAGTDDFATGFGLQGEITSHYEGASAGTMLIDLMAAELLDSGGAWRTMPGVLRGGVRTVSFPTGLLQPLAASMDLDLNELLGPALAFDVKAGMLEAAPATALSPARVPGPYVAGELQSDRTSAWFNVFVDTAGVRSRGKGVQVQCDAVAYLLKKYMGDTGVEIGGEPGMVLNVEKFDIPLNSDNRPQWARASAEVMFDLGELVLSTPPTVSGERSRIEIETTHTLLTLAPGKPATAAMAYKASADGSPFGLQGQLSIDGVSEALAAIDAGRAVDPAMIRPSGTVRASQVPMSLAALASAETRAIAEAAIGRSLDLTLDASPGQGSGSSSITLTLNAERAEAKGGVLVDASSLRTSPGGLVATLRRPGDVLAALNPPTPDGLIAGIEGSTPLTLTVSDLIVPMGGASDAVPQGRVEAKGGGLAVNVRGEAGQVQQILVRTLDAAIASVNRDEVRLNLNVVGEHDGRVFGVTGGLAASGLSTAMAAASAAEPDIEPGGAESGRPGEVELPMDLRKLKLTGAIKAENVPTALVSVVDASQGTLVREAVGPTLNLDIAARDARMPALDIKLAAEQINASTVAVVSDGAVAIGPTNARARVRPGAVAALLADPEAGGTAPLTLDQPAQLELAAGKLTLPLRDGRVLSTLPDGELDVSLKASDDILLTARGKDGSPPQSLGIRGLSATAQVDSAGAGHAKFNARAFDPRDASSTLANVVGDVGLPFGDRPFVLDVNAQDTARIDRVLATDGLLSSAVGADVRIKAEGSQGESGRMTIRADVASPKLNGAARLTRSNEGFTLDEPATVRWLIEPAILDRFVFEPPHPSRLPQPTPLPPPLTDAQLKQMPKEQRRAWREQRARDEELFAEQQAAYQNAVTRAARGATIRAAAPLETELRLSKLAVGNEDRPLDPRVFRADTGVTVKHLVLATASGERLDLGTISGSMASVDGAPRPGLRFRLQGDGATGASGGRFNAEGSLADIADQSGVLTTDQARVTSTITGDLPTLLLDALGEQEGSLVDLLGPRVNADLRTTDLSRTGGALSAKLVAANASVTASGSIADDVLTLRDGARVEVSRITPEFTSRFVQTAIPIIDRVEKTESDRPSVITANGLTIPLNGDTRSLNGVVKVDLGEVRFQASSFFGRVLSAVGGRAFGQIGRKIQPFDVVLTRGVARYDRITIPAGDFDFDTKGKVNLNDSTMDVVVFVPASAVANEVASVAGRVPGLNRATMLPLRFRGPTANPSMEVDVEMMLEEVPRTILQAPGNIVDGVGGILGGVLGGGRGSSTDQSTDGSEAQPRSAEPTSEPPPAKDKSKSDDKKAEKDKDKDKKKDEDKKKDKDKKK